jgi:hypothetical protein
MSRVPDLVPDSDTGAAKNMVTKTVDRLTADTVSYPKGDHKSVVG